LRGGGTGGSRDAEALGIADAAMEWRRSNEEAAAAVSGLDPARWTSVRYEDLCDDPGGTLRSLFGFIGVDPDAGSARPDAGALHVIGNGMRLDGSPPVRLDERWKESLTPRALRTFDAVAGSLNRSLGYR
jgi:hypothetical protein